MEHVRLTALIETDTTVDVALCPELDIASEAEKVEEARASLTEALGLFLKVASAGEVPRRLAAHSPV